MNVFDLAFPFDPWMTSRQPSVYVISDSEMKAYKQKQAVAEVLELKRLIDYHKCQAERLERMLLELSKSIRQQPLKRKTPDKHGRRLAALHQGVL